MNKRRLRLLATLGASGVLLALEAVGIAQTASPPQLYSVLANHNPATEGPVRGDPGDGGTPGDLLLLPGTGFTVPGGDVVVYQAVGDTTTTPPTPSSVPTGQAATLGVITPVAEDANTVTIQLPGVLMPGQPYALWVVGPGGWSNPAMINDARPMWMMPGPMGPDHGTSPNPYAYSTAPRPGMGRYMGIVGRNLQPIPGQETQVRFVDPSGTAYPGTVLGGGGDPGLRYGVEVQLPDTLPVLDGGADAGYTVEISRGSLDGGANWVSLATPLTVLPDPPPGNFGPTGCDGGATPHAPPFFFPQDYAAGGDDDGGVIEGGCSPCDTADDTLCITRAIAAAHQYVTSNSDGGIVSATVVLGGTCEGQSPTWTVATNPYDIGAGFWGIEVPTGVNLVGDPCAPGPIIQTGTAFDQPVIDTLGSPSACSGTANVTPCSQDTDCCPSGNNALVCYGAPLGVSACQPEGTSCTSDGQCCSGTCSGGSCTAGSFGQCQAAGTSCTEGSQCCSQSCATQRCVASKCQWTGAACTSDSDCIGTFCAWGTCEARAPWPQQTLFYFNGANYIEGIHFKDTVTMPYEGSFWYEGPIMPYDSPGLEGVTVRGNDVVFNDDIFENTRNGISTIPATTWDGRAGNSGILVLGSQFETWNQSVTIGYAEDCMVAGNTFSPGVYMAPIPVSTGGSQRVAVTQNILDGADTTYSGTYLGFRAGVFFPADAPHENLVVAGNTMSCVGTRPYQNGEAIGFDNNGDPNPGFRSGEPVVSATTGGAVTTVTVNWPASATSPFVSDPSLYTGRFLQVSSGPGLGQARKITSTSTPTSTITFTVSPPFDVVPTTASRVLVDNLEWQTYIVNNIIDNDADGGCTPSGDITSLDPTSAGVIAFAEGAADTVIESNTQTNTAGILTWPTYLDQPGSSASVTSHTGEYFVDIRGNSIEGKLGGPDADSNHYGSGIYIRPFSSVMVDGVVQDNPNVPVFGLSVAQNTLTDAALMTVGGFAVQSAGIALAPQTVGNESSSPGMLDTLVFANNVDGNSLTASSYPQNSAAVINGSQGIPNLPNYPVSTFVCDPTPTSFPSSSPGYIDLPDHDAGQTSSILVCTPACAGGWATDIFGGSNSMVGCVGAVTWDQRATLCGPSYEPCTAAQWNTNRGYVVPNYDYWTADDMSQYSGTSGSCEAVTGGANACDTDSPMRVCTPYGSPAGTDSLGNTCALVGCGDDTYTNQYFGGCTSNPTAGTLCCPMP